jgi:uncharacterized membrane protein
MIPIQHIHPMLVHFPIVLIFLLATVDVAAMLLRKTVTGRTATGNVSTALAVLMGIFSVLAYLYGGMALTVAEAGGFHSGIAETHESLGEIVAIAASLYALVRAVLWWRDTKITGAASILAPLVAVAGLVLISTTAYYGGQLVYDLGVNVQKLSSN